MTPTPLTSGKWNHVNIYDVVKACDSMTKQIFTTYLAGGYGEYSDMLYMCWHSD